MIDESDRYTNSWRFIFKRGDDGSMYIEDTLGHFNPVQLSERLADTLSMILWEHTQLVNEKEKKLFDLNNLVDFINKNADMDKDILIMLLRLWNCD